MNFAILFRSIMSSFLSPMVMLWILLITSLILLLFKNKKWSNIFFIATFLWFALISFSPIPDIFMRSLENRYKPLKDLDQFSKDAFVYILVLGGGHTSDPTLPANDQLTNITLGRLVEGIRLHNLLQNSKLVTSGWQGEDPYPEAIIIKKVALSLGVLSGNIQTIATPTNTEQEAECFLETFGKDHKLILVTDASHMPRAMMSFQKVGLNPIAASTNHFIKNKPIEKSLSLSLSSYNINKMEFVMHEYFGMLWLWIKN